MPSRSRADRGDAGTVTAEFAVALPAVILVLATALAGLHAGAAQVRAIGTASIVARSLARGDPPGVVGAALAADPGASVERAVRGALTCVTVQEAATIVPIAASACALTSVP